jgi:hypothetical protein
MNAAVLLLAVTLLGDIDALILKSGHQLPVNGPVTLENGKLVFRHPSGVLYSIAASEVDLEATREARGQEAEAEATGEAAEPRPVRKLRVSAEEKERILREMEQSRGVPSPPQSPEAEPSRRTEPVSATPRPDEAYWRGQSRRLEQQVQQHQENITLLTQQVRRLEDQLLAFLAMGVPPDQFGQHVLRLEDSRARLQQARLALSSAEREWDDFREQARRQGILPGWLR